MFNRLEFHNITTQDDTLFKSIDFTLSYSNLANDAGFYSGTIPVVWGALQIGETYTQNKTLTYFRGFPFTIPLYIEDSIILEAVSGGKTLPLGGFNKGKLNIPFDGGNLSDKVRILSVGESRYSIFDYTFNYTFRPQVVTSSAVLDFEMVVNIVDCPNDGVYLRWINQYGEYNYYLFTPGASSVEIKNNDVSLENMMYTTALEDNYHFGVGKAVGKAITGSQKLAASLIDKDTFNLLLGLVKSPIVDMFVGYSNDNAPQWVNVSIKDGTFSRSTSHLQDFECYLVPNEEFVQSL